jgi:hypothetical protein
VDPATRGDPESPLRWTTKSTANLADALTAAGHPVSPDTVGGLLKADGFSLQGNAKTVEGAQHPDRDGQFRHINALVSAFQAAGEPVISVDSKKKELVGNYENGGKEYRPKGEPEPVDVHDFKGELGRAVPYGVYDMTANVGWVNVGTDADTGEFAVESIRRWWTTIGQAAYPGATKMLITADAGGSNGSRLRLWKVELARLATRTRRGDQRLPPAAGNQQVEPDRAPVVLPDLDELARAAADQPRGHHRDDHRDHHPHRAHCPRRPGQRHLRKGHQDPRQQMKTLEQRQIRRDGFHGDWNYTLLAHPEHDTPEPT